MVSCMLEMVKKTLQELEKAYIHFPYFFLRGHAFLPRTVIMELNYQCNLRCSMCYLVREKTEKEMGYEKGRELSADEWGRVIDKIPRITNLTFTGGETLIRNDALAILERAAHRHITHILTNGTLINPEVARSLSTMGLNSLTISLDGWKETHDRVRNFPGCFDLVMKAIEYLKEEKEKGGKKKPLIGFNYVILDSNVEDMGKIANVAEEMGIDWVSFQLYDPSLLRSGLDLKDEMDLSQNPVDRVMKIPGEVLKEAIREVKGIKGRTRMYFVPPYEEEEIAGYYQGRMSMKGLYCYLPWTLTYISPYGDVYPCYGLSFGNVRETNLAKIWNGERYRNFRKELARKKLFPACIGCCNVRRWSR